MKKYLSIIVGLMLVLGTAPVFAAAGDVSVDSNVRIAVGSETFSVLGSATAVDSITVNGSTNFTVALSVGEHLAISASSNAQIGVTGDLTKLSVSITSCNSTGSSVDIVASDTVTATVTPGTTACAGSGFGGGFSAPSVPSAAQNLTAIAGNAQVTLSWQAPATDGNSAITNYKVYRGTISGAETLLTTLGNVLTYANTGLTNGTAYYYKVSAANVVGAGPLSSEVSATPLSTASSVTTPAAASTPAASSVSTTATVISTPTTSTPSVSAPAVSTAPATAVSTVSAYTFTAPLKLGSKGTAVTELQKRLTSEGVYSGPVSGYFGTLTQAAVKKYQEQENIATAGQPGYGNVGPLTRAALKSSVPAAAVSTSATTPAATATATVSGITTAQATSIIGLLQSFGADASIIANVKASLGIK